MWTLECVSRYLFDNTLPCRNCHHRKKIVNGATTRPFNEMSYLLMICRFISCNIFVHSNSKLINNMARLLRYHLSNSWFCFGMVYNKCRWIDGWVIFNVAMSARLVWMLNVPSVCMFRSVLFPDVERRSGSDVELMSVLSAVLVWMDVSVRMFWNCNFVLVCVGLNFWTPRWSGW